MDRAALTAAVRRQTNLTTADVSDADVFAILNEGIQEISGLERWDFLYKRSTLTTVAATAEITLPADFQFMDFVQEIGKSNGPLLQISFQEYSYRFGDDATSSATARYYYLRHDDGTQKIGIYPTPSASTTDKFEIFYFKQPTELAATDDSPEWDATHHNILVDYAAYRLWEREEYFDEAERAFRRYTRRLGDMVRFYNKRDKVHRFVVGDGAYYKNHRNFRVHLGFE